MGYYEDIEKQKITNAEKVGNRIAEQILKNKSSEINKSIEAAHEAGVQKGAMGVASMLGMAPKQTGALGMNRGSGQQMSEQALMEKAESIVNLFDDEEKRGTSSSVIAKKFNSLPPVLKSKVAKIKQLRLENSKNSQPGSAVERRMSPITETANKIVRDTLMIK